MIDLNILTAGAAVGSVLVASATFIATRRDKLREEVNDLHQRVFRLQERLDALEEERERLVDRLRLIERERDQAIDEARTLRQRIAALEGEIHQLQSDLEKARLDRLAKSAVSAMVNAVPFKIVPNDPVTDPVPASPAPASPGDPAAPPANTNNPDQGDV